MGYTQEDDNLFAVFSKKNISFCEKYFVEQLSHDFQTHIDFILNNVTEKISTATTFKDKQILNDIHKKISTNKKNICEEFKVKLKYNLHFLIESNRNDFGFIEIRLSENFDKETTLIEESKKSLETAITKSLGSSLDSVLQATNYLLGKDKDIFKAKLLTETLHNILKEFFNNSYSLILVFSIFEDIWPQNLKLYYEHMNDYLTKNNVFKKIEETMSHEKPKVDKNIVPDFNSFLEKMEKQKDEPQFFQTNTTIESSKPNLDLNFQENSNNSLLDNFLTSKEEEEEKKQKEKEKEIKIQKEIKIEPQFVDPEVEIKNQLKSLSVENIKLIEKVNFPNQLNEDYLKIKFKESFGLSDSKIITFDPFLNTLKNINSKLFSLSDEKFANPALFKKNIIFEIGANQTFKNHMNLHDRFVFNTLSNFYDLIFNHNELNLKSKILIYKTQLFILFNFLNNKNFFDSNNSELQFLNLLLNKELEINNELYSLVEQYTNNLNGEDIFKINISPIFHKIFKQLIDIKNSQLNELKQKTPILIKNLENQEKIEHFYNIVSQKMVSIAEKTSNKCVQYFIDKVFPYYYIQAMSKHIDLNIFSDDLFIQKLPLAEKVKWHQYIQLFEDMIFISNLKEITISQQEKIRETIRTINSRLGKISVDLNVPEKLIKAINYLIKLNLELINKKNTEDQNNLLQIETSFIGEIDKLILPIITAYKAEKDMEANQFNLGNYLKETPWFSFSNKQLLLVDHTTQQHFFLFANVETKEIIEYPKQKIWYLIKNKALKQIIPNSDELKDVFIDSLKKTISS